MRLDPVRHADTFVSPSGVDSSRPLRFGFATLAGACIVLSAVMLGGRKSAAAAPAFGPLRDLADRQGSALPAHPVPARLEPQDVTFPGMLSDAPRPTTALASLQTQPAAPSSMPTASTNPSTPRAPRDYDRLAVVPLPAQELLQANSLMTRPRDALTRAAAESSQLTPTGSTLAEPGREGAYQLQISSFRTAQEANAFGDVLRARGHHAYVTSAPVPDRGMTYRVRIGPFASRAVAAAYRASFEAREHVVSYILASGGKSR